MRSAHSLPAAPCGGLAGVAMALLPVAAEAHTFGRLYNLPVPFWMYVYGASAALLLSFLVAGWFLTKPAAERGENGGRWIELRLATRLLPLFKALSLLALLLCVLTGLFGNGDPYRNINMTLFWVVFVLGFSYLSACAGDLFALLNPWALLARGLARLWPRFAQGRIRYPQALAYWPALGLYMAFIWIELFGHTAPFSLGVILLLYTALNLLGVWLVGAVDWFCYCEFFSVLLRLLAKMAPVEYRHGKIRLRAPFSGLTETPADSLSLLLFLLFMLSSTAFDGLSATQTWFRLFWGDPTGWLRDWFGAPPLLVYPKVLTLYWSFATLCLLLSPFVYLALYLMFIALAKRITRSPRSVRELALAFAYSLLPIVLVYNITHYYTLILTQGVKIVSLLSDPFGWGWNLFGTARLMRAPILPDMGLVWHSQVGLILFGHVVSVVVAHREALRVFATRRAALLSQLPMLVLMVLFTAAGLWILAQPLQTGR